MRPGDLVVNIESSAGATPGPQDFELHFSRGKDGRLAGPVLIKGTLGDNFELTFERDKSGRISGPVQIKHMGAP